MPSSQVRERYASDGRSKWPFLPSVIAAAVVPAAVVAWLMSLAFSCGFYFPVLMTAIAGWAVGAAVSGVVSWTHCRNHWLAGMVALVMGAVTYLGYYQFSLAQALPRASKRGRS